MKKYILGLIIAWSVPFVAFAATPQLIATATGDGNNVLVTVTSADGTLLSHCIFDQILTVSLVHRSLEQQI